jgi:hypothetical protein
MILYRNDWGRQDATVQINTTNESFKRMHFVLKDMGVKNNAFFLALHQPELLNVNPHDYDSITPEIAAKISIECKINPWYYIREIVRIPATGVEAIPFILNRANLFLFWAFFNSCATFLIQPRQTGKTIGSMALIVCLMYFTYINTRIKLFTHSNQLIIENVSRLKTIRDELPPYLIHVDKNLDTENKEEIRYAALNNVYATKTAQKDIAGAFNAGRGGTVLVNQLDEAPFCSNIRISYPVLMNAKNAAMAIAREHNIPFGDIITTTAAKLNTDSGAYVYNIMRKCCAFNERMYDLESNAALKYVLRKNSQNGMLYGEFSFRQLGKTVEWAEEVARENNLEQEDIERDLYNRWSSGSERPAVDVDLLAKMDDGKTHPVHTEEVDGYLFRWYEHPTQVWSDPNRFFVMGLDTSENIDEDFTTIHFMDISDLSTVMTSRCNDSDLVKLGLYLAKMLIAHPNFVLVPERRSTASVLIAIICAELWKAGINPFTRIYNKVFQCREEMPFSKMDVSNKYASEGPTKKFIGFTTTASGENSRDALYKFTLNRALKMNYAVVRDINLIQELHTLTLRNGRIDHLAGGHDDSVISFMLAAWFIIHGRNHHLYGIPTHIKLAKIGGSGEAIDMKRSHRQRQLQIRIKELEKQINGTTDSIIKVDLIKEKKFLENSLLALGPGVQSVAAIGDLQSAPLQTVDMSELAQALSRDAQTNKLKKQMTDPLFKYW